MQYKDISKYIYRNRNENNETMPFQTNYGLKLDFQKVDQHTGGKWVIHATEHRKDNQLQSLQHPCRVS